MPRPRREVARGRHRTTRRAGSGASTAYAVAAAAVCGLAVLFFAMRGGNEVPAPEAPPAPAPKPPPDKNEELRGEARQWFVDTFLDDMYREKPLPGDRIDDLLEEGKKRGFDRIPGFDWEEQRKRVYERLLRREPDHPEANRAFGRVPLVDYPDFYGVFRKLTDAISLPPELKAFRTEYEDRVRFTPTRSAPAVEPEEFRRVTALLDRFKALDERFTKDPTFKAISEALDRVRIDPILGQYEAVHVEVGPFCVFYGSRELKAGKADVAARLKARIESFRQLINDLIEFHRERWIKPLGLKDFEPGEVFFVWIFGDEESWQDYGRQVGAEMPAEVKGYFNPRDHWAFLYDDTKDPHLVEVSLAHELTHLLHWRYSKDPESEFRNHFDQIPAVWFREGWAEYVSWVKREGDHYVFAQDSPFRMEIYQTFRKRELPLYPLQDLVKRESYLDWAKEVFETWLPKRVKLPEDPGQLKSLWDNYFAMLYSESWLFMKFLYDGEGGKYRQKTLEFTKATLKGYLAYRGERGYARAHEVFEQIFELKTKADWDRLQAEFDRFLEKKLYEVQPPK